MTAVQADVKKGPWYMEIAILMTCHNRRQTTQRCLAALVGQQMFKPENLFLVDDGSQDGTGEAVRALLPTAHVIDGDGSLFWNGGMRLAWSRALAENKSFDFYLWLNDDVELRPDALDSLVADAAAVASPDAAVIIAGSTVDLGSEEINYGAHRRPSKQRPLRLQLIEPIGRPQPVFTVSGNIVLVSHAAERALGNLSPAFEHIYGDLDYGYRAAAKGVPIFLASRVAGGCASNTTTESWLDQSIGLLARLQRRRVEDGRIHARDWRRFARLHSGLGPLSILYTLAPYARILFGRSSR